jgi:flagellar FliL protein
MSTRLDEPGPDRADWWRTLLGVTGALVLVVGGMATAYSARLFDPLISKMSGPAEPVLPMQVASGDQVTFYELPDILVNAINVRGDAALLKLRVSLELASAGDLQAVEAKLPVILDNFNIRLRDLRLDQLKDAANFKKLRGVLLAGANSATAPARISDLLFGEIVVQ